MHFGNLALLLGLAAVSIPIVLHLLQRRRFDTLDWGAMQFLPESTAAQRRRWLDEILLMILRMAVVALLVLGLAMPIATSGWLHWLMRQPTRDVVLVLDGSYSMDARIPGQQSPWQSAVDEALARIENAEAGERFAILLARQPPHFVISEFTDHVDELRQSLRDLPAPRGNAAMSEALAQAWSHLRAKGRAPAAEIRVFTDRQLHGWADDASLQALDRLGESWRADTEAAIAEGCAIPALRIMHAGPELPSRLPNLALTPLSTSRAKVGQTVTLRSSLVSQGHTTPRRPRKISAWIDGVQLEDLALSEVANSKAAQMPLTFTHRFQKEGPALVTLRLEADAGDDVLTTDNEQHLVVDVVKDLPVMLVEGDPTPGPESGTFFAQQVLAAKDPHIKNAVVVPYPKLSAEALAAHRPAVVVFSDVPKLTPAQVEALMRFVAEGGGLFIALGERAVRESAFYRQLPFLPATIIGVGASKEGTSPDPRSFQHPALGSFRDGSLRHVRFPQWAKVKPVMPDSVVIASLVTGEPFLIERAYQRGRVMLMTTPLGRHGGSTLPSAAEFPVLLKELAHTLAGTGAESSVLHGGAVIPISQDQRDVRSLMLKTPEHDEKRIDVAEWPWTFANTSAIGVYRVKAADRAWTFIRPPDLAEADLTRCTPEDWRFVEARLPIASSSGSEGSRAEMWWLFLCAVLVLLIGEVVMTRRMTRLTHPVQ